MKRFATPTMAILLITATGMMWVNADPPVTPINHAPSALMRSKLVSSQNVLEGLLRKDFDAIARGAREMKRISEAAEWPRARDSVYEHFGLQFRRQCSQLESLAKQRNHEGVTFTYLQMTTTCVQCHDYVRDSLRIAERHENGSVQLIPAEWPQQNVRNEN
tara:strand:+ start:32360 stop:32842 length:483 start_codon:yes stop_codon:yes gene_type:complete